MPKSDPDAHAGAGSSPTPVELEAFIRMADRWRLSTEEQISLLGSPGRSTFFKWKKEGGALPADTRERLSYLLRIWKALVIVMGEGPRGEEWVRKKNRYFDGASALDVMLEGMAGVIRVARYLDAQRGG